MGTVNQTQITNVLVGRIGALIIGKVARRQEDIFIELVEYAEPDLAIVKALNWAGEGAWTIPDHMVDLVQQWSAGQSYSAYRRAAERALSQINMSAIAA